MLTFWSMYSSTMHPRMANCPFSPEATNSTILWRTFGGSMQQIYSMLLLGSLMLGSPAFSQLPQSHPALRVAIVGLVHGHVHGFLTQYQHSPEIQIVAAV